MFKKRCLALGVIAVLASIIVFLLLACVAPSSAQRTHHHSAALPTPAPGCQVTNLTLTQGGNTLTLPTVLTSTGILSTALVVEYSDPSTTQIGRCPLRLRTYNGQLAGPTLRVKPGDTLRIHLQNHLPMTDSSTTLPMNQLRDFNTTNLHTHGLHVSPVGNSDNVLLAIGPHQAFQYEIKVPLNQTPGTYWYHAHMHGSTATQVASGMAGALIVEGGLDELSAIQQATEQILLFQQIVYDEYGQIEPTRSATETFPTLVKTLGANNVGYFGPCSWEPTLREHTINGQLFPKITMKAGEMQRWRMIHAGVRESIGVELHGPYTGTATPTITDVLKLPTVNLNEIAVDGIALGKMVSWPQVELEPGYRSDVLVTTNLTGTYYLVDNGVLVTTTTQDPQTGLYTTTTQTSDALTCPSSPEQPNFLATVVVTGSVPPMPLPTAAELAPLAPLEPLITLNPNAPVTSEAFLSPTVPIDGFQVVDFTVAVHSGNLGFLASDHPFSHARVRQLKLGATEQWIINTREDSLYYAHPFHIHVNPFQTWRFGPDGAPETVWRDTILVRQGVPVYFFTRYTDYIGTFVYHCHILDHEDQGMMELLEVVQDPM